MEYKSSVIYAATLNVIDLIILSSV